MSPKWVLGQKDPVCKGKLIKQIPRNEQIKETGKILKGFLFLVYQNFIKGQLYSTYPERLPNILIINSPF